MSVMKASLRLTKIEDKWQLTGLIVIQRGAEHRVLSLYTIEPHTNCTRGYVMSPDISRTDGLDREKSEFQAPRTRTGESAFSCPSLS